MRDLIGGLLLALAAKIMTPQTLRRVMAKVHVPPAEEPPSIAWWVVCPECDQEVPIGLLPLRLDVDDEGDQVAVSGFEMTDVWAHSFTHQSRQ